MAARKNTTGKRKYAKAASAKVAEVMHEKKAGTLRSGRSKKKVTSRKQAIAIGLSEARRAGVKVPEKRASADEQPKKTAKKKAANKPSTGTGMRKKAAKKKPGRQTASKL